MHNSTPHQQPLADRALASPVITPEVCLVVHLNVTSDGQRESLIQGAYAPRFAPGSPVVRPARGVGAHEPGLTMKSNEQQREADMVRAEARGGTDLGKGSGKSWQRLGCTDEQQQKTICEVVVGFAHIHAVTVAVHRWPR